MSLLTPPLMSRTVTFCELPRSEVFASPSVTNTTLSPCRRMLRTRWSDEQAVALGVAEADDVARMRLEGSDLPGDDDVAGVEPRSGRSLPEMR